MPAGNRNRSRGNRFGSPQKWRSGNLQIHEEVRFSRHHSCRFPGHGKRIRGGGGENRFQSKRGDCSSTQNIQIFASHQLPKNWNFSPRPGVVLGEKFTPMDRVGCYIPGGTAPLVSTVLHTAGIAAAAGVKEIVAATPPMKDGSIHAATLYALKTAGVKEVYRMGGAYAIAALAYGTDTVRKVEKSSDPATRMLRRQRKSFTAVSPLIWWRVPPRS